MNTLTKNVEKLKKRELENFQRRKSLKIKQMLPQNQSLEVGAQTQELQARHRSPNNKMSKNSVNLKINFGKNYLNHGYNVTRSNKHQVQNVYKLNNLFANKKVILKVHEGGCWILNGFFVCVIWNNEFWG